LPVFSHILVLLSFAVGDLFGDYVVTSQVLDKTPDVLPEKPQKNPGCGNMSL